jgi:N-acetylmuramoyl-L-alanine amidase
MCTHHTTHPWHRIRPIPALLLLILLAACGTYPGPNGLTIDHSIRAVAQNSRVSIVVLHYTSANNANSLEILSRQNVSSHYLITDNPTPHVYQLADENRRAWHAGVSQWYGHTSINSLSVGIELVNAGGQGHVWAPYNPAQITTLITLLHDIVERNQIKPENIVGHSDVAPQRKVDPGPLFPWKQLAQAGLGRWYDDQQVAENIQTLRQSGLPDIHWFQKELIRIGYSAPTTGILDKATKNVLTAFQMHYRPTDYDGQPDLETAAILKALP